MASPLDPERATDELVLDTQPTDGAFRVGAGASAAAAIGSAVWAYFEYLGRARAGLLSLALAGVCLSLAATVLFTFRAAYAFESVQGPRPRPPPMEAPVDLGIGERRGVFAFLGAAAVALLGIVLLPLRSLGGSLGPTLRRTAWRRGVRLVTPEGAALRPEDLPAGSFSVVVPRGALGDTNSTALLVRLRGSSELRAYSRICTHAGCAVSVFRSAESQLICPCHYSVFDAANGGAVVSGPASRSLAELPLGVDDEGFLVAEGDYTGPIGPRLG